MQDDIHLPVGSQKRWVAGIDEKTSVNQGELIVCRFQQFIWEGVYHCVWNKRSSLQQRKAKTVHLQKSEEVRMESYTVTHTPPFSFYAFESLSALLYRSDAPQLFPSFLP